jgi:hypothetical protein
MVRQTPSPTGDRKARVPIKPNYSFEKRQRELAKKRKKEEKAARKAGSPADVVPAGGTPEPAPPAPADKA